jgi:hypothetical protein
MGIIMLKVGKAFWVFGFSSLGAGIGGGGVALLWVFGVERG